MICSHRFLLTLIHGFKLPWNFFFFFKFHPPCGWVPFSNFAYIANIYLVFGFFFFFLQKRRLSFACVLLLCYCCCWSVSVLGCLTSWYWMNVEFCCKTSPMWNHFKYNISIYNIEIRLNLSSFQGFHQVIEIYNRHENSLTDALLVLIYLDWVTREIKIQHDIITEPRPCSSFLWPFCSRKKLKP